MHLKSPTPLHPSCLVLILHLHHCLPSNYMFALVHICTHMYRYVYNNCIYTHTHIQLYVRVHVRACLYVVVCACACAGTLVCVWECMSLCTHHEKWEYLRVRFKLYFLFSSEIIFLYWIKVSHTLLVKTI